MNRARGFTLVEVMVALAVVAIALPALMVSLYQQADNTGYLRDKSLANSVAARKLAEIRILSRVRQTLISGKDSGTETMADRDWYWWVDSQPTEVENFYRVAITVAPEEEQRDQPLLTLVAYMSADLTPDSEPDTDPEGELGVGSGSAGSARDPAESAPPATGQPTTPTSPES